MLYKRCMGANNAMRQRKIHLLIFMAVIGALVLSQRGVQAAGAMEQDGEPGKLSSYWAAEIQQWESEIVTVAQERQLDPDFLASLVWMESRGDPQAIGPVGAVGLMQVMPKEAGFSWRPSREALLEPQTNLQAGCRTLVDIIHQGGGDLFNTLAAYNGGWEQIMYRGPKFFATTIMRDYAAAVAVREGLESQGAWHAIFAPRQGERIGGPVWVVDPHRDDVFYFGDSVLLPDGGSLVPLQKMPTAIVARYQNQGSVSEIVLWLYNDHTESWITH